MGVTGARASWLSLGEGSGGSAKLEVANDSKYPVTYDLSGVSTVATGPSFNDSTNIAQVSEFAAKGTR